MAGHIKLGTSVALLRDYILTDPRARVRELANPYAAKVGMGAGKYDDLTSWSAWVMDDWQRGVGREKVEDGGMAFSTLDSRVPGQLILPPALGRVKPYHGGTTANLQVMPADANGTYTPYTIGVGRPYNAIMILLKSPSATIKDVQVYANVPADATCQLIYFTNDGGHPLEDDGIPNVATAIKGTGKPDFRWVSAGVPLTVGAGETPYWLGLWVTAGTMTVVCHSGVTGSASLGTVTDTSGTYDFTQYANDPLASSLIYQMFFEDETSATALPTRQYAWMGDTSTSKTYLIADQNGALDVYELSGNLWTSKATSASTTLASNLCAAWCGSVYIPASAAGVSYMRYPEGAASLTTYGAVGSTSSFDGFAMGQGYLWGWDGNKVYYSNVDTVTATDWVGPIEVGSTQFPIKSMCAFGDYMYMATDDALWYMGYGDVPIGVVRFPSRSVNTGVSMVEFQGTLYIAVAGRVWQYSSTGAVTDVWFPYTGDTGIQRGDVINLCATGQNLYAVALPETITYAKTEFYVYSWNGQGWHTVMVAPTVNRENCNGWLYYNRSLNRLYLSTSPYYVFWVRLPDSFINPYRDIQQTFMYSAYMTTPWFDGDLIDVAKDYESVFVTGENLLATRYVDIWWQDDGSTAWEYLGRADSVGEEVRWSSAATRPNTKRIRFLLALYTNEVNSYQSFETLYFGTPQVTGVRVKYRANVSDRWRWSIPVAVHPNQQFPDGSINSYTAAQQAAHLEALAKQVPPIFYQDVDGKQYEVWVTNCREQIIEYEYYNSAHYYMQQYLLTLEQCQSASVN